MKLFEPGAIGALQLKNRLVMAPIGTMLGGADGAITREMIDFYTARAEGGVGLVIVPVRLPVASPGGHIAIPAGFAGLRGLARAVQGAGAALCVQLQVNQGRTVRRAEGYRGSPLAPSAMPCYFDPTVWTREMTRAEIAALVSGFRTVAARLRDFGVDALELHGHKGALLDQFTTALWNRRDDEYGGDLEGRLRIAVEIVASAKAGAGTDFPVVYRYGLTHYLTGGREPEEGIAMARRLEAAGVDALHVNAGCQETAYWAHPPTTMPAGCMVGLASAVKKAARVPVIAVGKLGDPGRAERVLREGKADFIALGRPLIADPEWAKKARGGRWRAICPCLGDNEGCEAMVERRQPLSCTVNPAAGREKAFALAKAARKKSVLVIGGGPAGMEAAFVAAERGHDVVLWEKGERLGGNLIAASTPAFKRDYRRYLAHLVDRLRRCSILVETGKEATVDAVMAMAPEAVFVATGGTAIIPDITGVERPEVMTAVDLLRGEREAGKTVAIIGGGLIGAEAALHLARCGKRVTVVELGGDIAAAMYRENREHLLVLMRENAVEVMTGGRVAQISGDGLTVVARSGETRRIEAETVLLAIGLKPNDALSLPLAAAMREVHRIGDCVAPGRIIDAVWGAFRAARDI